MKTSALILLICIIYSSIGMLFAQSLDEDQLMMKQYKLPEKALPDSIMTEIDSVMYLNGKLFTGSAYSLYDNGQLQHTAQYIKGLKHGTMYVWYPDGKPQLIANYRNNQLNGRFKGWYQFGAVIYDLVLKDSAYTGDQLYDTDTSRAETTSDDAEKTGDVSDQTND